jgi:hypothetical protein
LAVQQLDNYFLATVLIRIQKNGKYPSRPGGVLTATLN